MAWSPTSTFRGWQIAVTCRDSVQGGDAQAPWMPWGQNICIAESIDYTPRDFPYDPSNFSSHKNPEEFDWIYTASTHLFACLLVPMHSYVLYMYTLYTSIILASTHFSMYMCVHSSTDVHHDGYAYTVNACAVTGVGWFGNPTSLYIVLTRFQLGGLHHRR